MAIAAGVLPVPPAVKFPMQITGTLERYGFAIFQRARVAALQTNAAGVSSAGIRLCLAYHHDGVLGYTLLLLLTREIRLQRFKG